MKKIIIKDFKYGLIDSVDENAIPRNAASKALNFITAGVKIELRRGYNPLGATENSGTGRITGLGVGKKPNGSDIVFRTRKRKIEYLDTSLNDWVEIGTDTLASAITATNSLGEDVSIESYQNPTGPQIWLNSLNGGLFKVMTANPSSITNMFVNGTNYKGYMKIKSGRMFVWNRNGNPVNKTDLFASQLNDLADSEYTQISSEVIAASGTLAFKAAGARRICFQVTATVTATGETFTDNGDGTLTGSLGSTATIDYTTGAYSGLGVGTATYRWADDSSTNGIANFSFSATRVAGEGFILSQALGGDFQNLMSLNGKEYCLHKTATWVVNISADDLTATNLIYRSKVGISNHRAACETADGIYYVDDIDQNDIHFRILRLEYQSTEVIPTSISKQFKIADIKVGVNLNNYRFDSAASIEFGDYVLFACRTKDSSVNNRVLIYNKVNRFIDVLDYYVSCFAIYNGTLIAGDSVTDNVYTLFSGVDDSQSIINGYYESGLDNMGFAGLKKVVELVVDGEIGPEQKVKVLLSIDRSDFVEVRSSSDVTDNLHAIEGSGSYVDKTQNVAVGAFTLGRGEVGGGGDGLTAYHYRRNFRITLDKFEFIKFRVEPVGLGYFSLSEFIYQDVRIKSNKIPSRYRESR
jgi:hypothetical protein